MGKKQCLRSSYRKEFNETARDTFDEVKHGDDECNFVRAAAHLLHKKSITISERMPPRHFENIQKRWVGREEKPISSGGEGEDEWEVAAFQIISIFSFSLGQRQDVYHGNVIISGTATFFPSNVLAACVTRKRRPG